MIQLDANSLPDWLFLFEDDFDNLMNGATAFIEAAVERYRGDVDLWQCTARVNTARGFSFSEEDRLKLVAHAVRLVRAIDPLARALVSLDQPWGEYAAHREVEFPPLYFADALVRAGVDVSGFVLEINLGCSGGCTLPRSPLEFNRHLEHWHTLGLPLYLSLSVPSDTRPDPQASHRVALPAGVWTPQSQQAWIARYMPLILAKQGVQGVFWNQLRDATPHDFPHGGLFDEHGPPKPALRTLSTIRQTPLRSNFL